MKLIVPYVGELAGADLRLTRLAEFLGGSWETLALSGQGGVSQFAEQIANRNVCLAVNPEALRAAKIAPADLAAWAGSAISNLLVFAVQPDPFHDDVVRCLSAGRLAAVERIESPARGYEVARDAQDVCEAFAGISFGPADGSVDRVFLPGAGTPAARALIRIGGQPFLAMAECGNARVMLIAGSDVIDPATEVGDAPLADYFSRFVPHAMALRQVFGDGCWRPGERHAAVIIDDPPLTRHGYGFVNFETLRGLAVEHEFHAVVAFIPRNYRKSSLHTIRMFQESAAHLSIAFHGNDHTGSEMASKNTALLNTMLRSAEGRMERHYQLTGLPCEKVMVFPQGKFSAQAMTVLNARNFLAAVNTTYHPEDQNVRLTVGELAQPAVLRYGAFPLFLRQTLERTLAQNVAFNLFFGRPVFIVTHHEDYQHPEAVTEVAARINAIAPGIRWTSLAEAVRDSVLERREPDGTRSIRAYARAARVSNGLDSPARISLRWARAGELHPVDHVENGSQELLHYESGAAGVAVDSRLEPKSSEIFSVLHRNTHGYQPLGFKRHAKAAVRRQLSEVRDNYISKSPRALAMAKSLRHLLLRGV